MEPSLSSVTLASTETWPHALPYRIIIEEHRARRGPAFVALLEQWATGRAATSPITLPDAQLLLETDLTEVDRAYADLDKKHSELRETSRRSYDHPDLRKQAIDAAHAEAEAAAVACQTADTPLKQLLHLCSSSALCFSGGGIRSASFSLGILQGLARFSLRGSAPNGFLHQLHYLSTVSGGGYTGSWLMGWARRSSFGTTISELGTAGKTAGDPEPDPVRHLRDYTSFLAPRYGFTVDTATLLAIVLRNLFLNWIIFLPCLIALILLPRLLAMAGNSLAAWIISLPPFVEYAVMGAALTLIALAGWIAAYRAGRPPRVFGQPSTIFHIETLFVCVTLVASWLIVEFWLAGWADAPAYYSGFLFYANLNGVRVFSLILAFTAASLPMSVGRFTRAMPHGTDPFRVAGRVLWGRVLWSFCAPLLAAAVVSLALELVGVHVFPILYGSGDVPGPPFHVLALPTILFLLMLGSGLLSGLLSSVESEEEREWWARAGGVFFIILLAWICAQVVSWYSDYFVTHALLLGSGAALFGGGAAAAGTSAATAASLKHVDVTQLSRAGRFLARNQFLAPVLSFVGLVCILLLVGSLNELLLSAIGSRYFVTMLYSAYARAHSTGDIHFFNNSYDVAIILLGGVAVLLAALANSCINVNTFSLHGMYRMRLVRAFLGASNFGRDADRFTNFDKTDNIPQSDLQLVPDAPIHVVNTALNLVDARKQAWQQRKAESFTFTPFQCGSWRLGYAPTTSYGALHGVTLGTAMAISGAAFNPNMGYNSSPLVTLLMTLFNARLGWWLPNPAWASRQHLGSGRAQRYLGKNGPTFALASIVAEALGKTDDRRKWIQLSDGGHFENLGLYEMVLRRCRYIVLVDAGADRQFQFEDLGNAIRKINIDLGIPITFPGLATWPFLSQKGDANRYCMVGKIEYCCVDSATAPDGYLIYIKPQLIGQEPCDVTAYAAAHTAFPHETTANQFFNEAQFESYRHLGSHVAGKILEDAQSNRVSDLLAAAFEYSGQAPF